MLLCFPADLDCTTFLVGITLFIARKGEEHICRRVKRRRDAQQFAWYWFTADDVSRALVMARLLGANGHTAVLAQAEGHG